MTHSARPAETTRGGQLRWGWLALSLALILAACERAPEPTPEAKPQATPSVPALTLTRVTYADLPGWREDRLSEALPAVLHSCEKLIARPRDSLGK